MENTKEQVVAEWKAVNEPRLKEIKSANPDLYSAINLALNYLNKKLTGEELPKDIEEEVVIETQTEPIETFQTQELVEDYRFMSAQEIEDKFFGGIAQNDVHGIGVNTWERDFANKKLSELAEDEDDFKNKLNSAKNSIIVNVLGFGVLSKYLVPIGQQTTRQTSKTNADFKPGDKVKIPTSKSYGVGVGSANTIKNAILKKQDYLYVISLDEEEDVIILDEDEKGLGESYSLSKDNIELYDGAKSTQSKPKTNADFKVGDKVKLPFTKSATSSYDLSVAIKKAKQKGQDYLFVTEIVSDDQDTIGLWVESSSGSADFFSVTKDNIELYDGAQLTQSTSTPQPKEWTPQDLVGKKLKFNQSGKVFLVTKLVRNNPKNKGYELENVDTKEKVNYNIGFSLVQKWLDGKKAQNIEIVEEPTKKLYTLAVETDPAQVEYEIGFVANRGDRNSPSQSAGDLKFIYNNVPDAYNTIINTKFKGNDGNWYKIHVGTSGTWTWRKAK